MAGLFGGHKKSNNPSPTPTPTVAPTVAQQNGAAMGAASQNYGTSNVLGGTSTITRGTFLGS